MGQLDGKVVIVTGAAHGMGARHAARCVEEGALVVATDVRAEAGRATVVPLGDRAVFVEHDVTQPDSWTAVLHVAVGAFGRVDGLVNNAAVYPKPARIEDDSLDAVERALDVNAIGTWHGIRAVLPAMRAAGGGSIVNISSTAGMKAFPRLSAYSMSKWAVRGLTKVAAHELGADGIRVNSVHPGTIDGTGMFAAPADKAAYDALYRGVPLPRPGVADEVSSVVVFLLSDTSSYVTGSEHVVDGGLIA